MSDSNYIKIYSGNFIIIQQLVLKLESIGINPIIKDETESARLAGFGTFNQGTQELYVNNDEMDKAVPIIESTLAELKA